MQDEFWWIADVIKEFREERGLTQKQLAEMAGISVSHLSKIESHIRAAGRQTYLKIMKTLDVPEEKQLSLLAVRTENRMLRLKFWHLIQDCDVEELVVFQHSMEGMKKGMREGIFHS